MENKIMNTKTNNPLIIALVVIIVLFLLFGGGAMTGGMMNHGMNGNGWMNERSWMWAPTILTLVIGTVLGWLIFKKKK